MLRQFNRFLIIAILVGAAVLFTLANSEQVSIKLGPNFQLTTYAGVIYMAVFAAGCIAASLFALFFGFKSYLRERKLRSSERSRQAFFGLFVNARGMMAAHEWDRAREGWEQVLRRDPDNVIARVELSRCLEQIGDSREALKVLDATRASSRASAEVLLRATELNLALGNNTGASDNLALLTVDSPSPRAIELARDVSEKMGRFEDALEYQSQLDKVAYNADKSAAARSRIGYAQLIRDHTELAALAEPLAAFVRRHSTYVPALEKLADIEMSKGKIDSAAELLFKAAKITRNDRSKWERLISLWLSQPGADVQRKVDRAVAAARAAGQELRGVDRLRAELLLAQTYLAVNKAEEARRVLDAMSSIAEKDGCSMPLEVSRQRIILQGLCLARLGMAKDSAPLWQQLGEPMSAVTSKSPASFAVRGDVEPSPALSTP